ncbi:hypothetical protein Amsp01_074300 [Amycolatopsis sp. NBRC 101858]|uniref:hypothetical protein n=1 Tax=Amycolatopsis sp. NBRC 101858 TaxID=3032200 RepID=UPI00249FFB40|nr:hypothetical protein [Amycolatopsis sp. NBRC 101858]GLY41407.1 hypothetical protein Amsp01_074300 [Amycolatopsis sp. NBRC 101858]
MTEIAGHGELEIGDDSGSESRRDHVGFRLLEEEGRGDDGGLLAPGLAPAFAGLPVEQSMTSSKAADLSAGLGRERIRKGAALLDWFLSPRHVTSGSVANLRDSSIDRRFVMWRVCQFHLVPQLRVEYPSARSEET